MAAARYLAVEGPVGSGKSIVAKALAERLSARLIESPVDENPFLEKFFRDPIHYAFQTQLFFLLTRYKLLTTLFEVDLFHEAVVADFIFERDRLYAEILLGEAEMRLYRQVEMHLRRDIPKPQLVIFLQAPVEVLVRNISKRGRPFERKFMTEEFLARLVDEYLNFFFAWDQTPLLVVDCTTVDLDDEAQLAQLIDYILREEVRGTQYYSRGGWL